MLLAMGYEKDWTMGSTWTYKMAGTTLEIHTKPAFWQLLEPGLLMKDIF